MGQSEICTEGVGRSGLTWQSTLGRSVRRARVGFICLGIVSALVAHDRCVAQDSRLEVRPRKMATGKQNPAAGEYELKSVEGVLVSVPKQCVGAHRCPLFVFLPGGGIPARQMTDWLRPVADKYGMILLAPTEYGTSDIDEAMKETLQRFAIDPDKIAIIGRCRSGDPGMAFGLENLDVFSRVVSVSGWLTVTTGEGPKNKTTEFLVDDAFLASQSEFKAARELRRDGHPVKISLSLRGHEHHVEDYDYVGHWLSESWAKPNPANRTAPTVVADPLPALTIDVLTKMTAFWTSFSQEPDSIRLTGRRAHLHEVIVPVAEERPSVWMMDMPALAAKYPSVAADLQKAGLTAQEHDVYRVALISAQVVKVAGTEAGAVDATSVMAKNVEFMDAHPAEFKKLGTAGMANPDFEVPSTIVHPKVGDAMGPLGIWYTP